MSNALEPTQSTAVAASDEERAWKMKVRRADVLAKSSLVPEFYRGKPNEIMVAAMGLESLGVPLDVNTLKQTYVVKGRPGYMAQIQIALAHRHGHDIIADPEYVTDKSATIQFRRAGTDRWLDVTFTMADAVRAKLPEQNPTYKTYPDRMLLARAVTKAIGLYCPEVMLGLAGTADADEFGRAQHPAHSAPAPTAEAQSAIGPAQADLVAPAMPETPEPVEVVREAPASKRVENIPADIPAPEPKRARSAASQLHIDAGRNGVSEDDLDLLILEATAGRTKSASDLKDKELEQVNWDIRAAGEGNLDLGELRAKYAPVEEQAQLYADGEEPF